MSLEVDIKKNLSGFMLDVSFSANNETLGLLGASGCGKSLTLRCIAGVEKPDEGRIVVNNTVFFDSEKKINLSAQMRKSALLFQNYMLFPNFTVAQNIEAGIDKQTPKSERRALVADELGRFGLSALADRYPIQLSGGEQQRVALARMLVAKPAILMLDEPFSALDSHLKTSLERDLMDLFDEFLGTIVYVSHDIDEAFRFCDRIAVIDAGRIQQIATTQTILSKPASYAALRVSGVKNISAAKKVGEHRVEAMDWGITLTTEEEVPSGVSHLAVRASYIKVAKSVPKDASKYEQENSFECRIERITDSRFERSVTLRPTANPAASLQWRYNLLDSDIKPDLQKDGYARVIIPSSRIHLVSD